MENKEMNQQTDADVFNEKTTAEEVKNTSKVVKKHNSIFTADKLFVVCNTLFMILF